MRTARRAEQGVGLYACPAIYDILATPGTARELDRLQRLARRYCIPPARRPAAPGMAPSQPAPLWLEPACGSGRFVRLAAARSLRVMGFDREPAMVAYARAALTRRGLTKRARVFMADLTDFARLIRPGSLDFAFILDNTIRLLLSDAAMLTHFAQIACALRPGGIYAVGISLDPSGPTWDEDLWIGRRGACCVSQVVNYVPPALDTPRRERVISHVSIQRPRGVEHRDDAFELRTYTPCQWEGLVRRSALRCVASLDARGRPLAGRRLAYQIEVLASCTEAQTRLALVNRRGSRNRVENHDLDCRD